MAVAMKGLFILGDNSDNTIEINQTANLGVATLTVTGPKGTSNFPLSSVSNLFISEGKGNNTILLGNRKGFTLSGGDIHIDTGAGTDNVQLKDITVTVGTIFFNGRHGGGTGTDTVNYTNVLAGQSAVLPGNGPLTVNQTNVTFGFDFIFGTGGGAGTPFPSFGGARVQTGNDSIRITNSIFAPAPRQFAIGNLTILDANAHNTFFLDTMNVGPATISAGNGNNTLDLSHSAILQADVTLGTEAAGARGNNTITMDSDVVNGQHVLLQVLNESGVNGFLHTPGASTPGIVATTNNVSTAPDAAHRSQRHINHVTLSNMTFTAAFPVLTPQLGVRLDDGDYYFDTQRGVAITGSSFVASNVDLPGIMQVVLGDHIQNIQLGRLGALVAGVPAATDVADIDASQLLFSAGNDLDTVTIAVDATGQFIPVIGQPKPLLIPAVDFVQLGDNTLNPVQGTLFGAATNNQLPLPYVFLSGQVGSPAIDGNLSFTIGNNLSIPGLVNGGANTGSPLGWPIKQIETVIGHLLPTFLTGNLLDTFTPSAPSPVSPPTPFTLPRTLPKLEVGQNSGVVSPDNADNGLALFLERGVIQGDLTVRMGSGGFNHRESLVMNGVTAGNIAAAFKSDGQEVPDGNPNWGVYVALDHVEVTDAIFGNLIAGTRPGLFVTDSGLGRDFFYLGVIPSGNDGFGFDGGKGPVASDFLTVNTELLVILSDAGANELTAHNVTTGFGLAYGGSGMGNLYHDDGGNEGFNVFGFGPP
jgi:hypothetical protein